MQDIGIDDSHVAFAPSVCGFEHSWIRFKIFPVGSSGYIAALKGFADPFAQVKFCLTVSIYAAPAYLSLSNVLAMGGLGWCRELHWWRATESRSDTWLAH